MSDETEQVREDGAYREQDVTATIEQELQLARDGDGYEPRAVAEEIVRRFVSPLLAERDEVRRQLTAEHERAEGWHNSYQTMRAERDEARVELASERAQIQAMVASWEQQKAYSDRLEADLTLARSHGRVAQEEADRLAEEYARACRLRKGDSMPSDLDAAIRERLLAEALATLKADVKSEEMSLHYANCAVKYAGVIKAVLDRCDRMEASGDPLMLGAAHAIRTDTARALGITEEVERGH